MNWRALRQRLPSSDPLVLGVYAWALTIAMPCLESVAPPLTSTTCILSPVLLLFGWTMHGWLPRMADPIGALGFCGLSACTLVGLGSQSLGSGSPIVRLTMGALIWCLFAISWARVRHSSVADSSSAAPVPIDDASTPRSSHSLGSRLIIGLAGVVCAVLLALSGTPRNDGQGVLIAGLIVVASLKLTSAASALLERVERARAARDTKAQPAP